MPPTFLKAEQVVAAGLGLLLRQQTLPGLLWRWGIEDFRGAKDDTVSVRLPAYAPARTRALRSGAARVKDNIHERKVDVTLDLDVYKDVGITDEVLTLDIADFGAQVLNPVMAGVSEALEDEAASTITGTTYLHNLTHAAATDDAYTTLLAARARLNNAYIPLAGRIVIAGSDFESELLDNERFIDASRSGSTEALREAQIGRVAGMDVYTVPAIPNNLAFVMHRTAFAMVQAAPVVPAGAPWGATQTYNGNAIRTVRVFDPDLVEDRFVADAWCGVTPVQDTGHFTADPAAGGRFVPVTDPATPVAGQVNAWENDLARMVRAVKITVT